MKLSRPLWVVLLYGFSSGLPLALTGATLQAWMVTQKIDLTLIGVFSLVGMPYSLKFLWAPAMDRYVPSFLGRRRGWILVTQMALVVTLVGMAFCNPVVSPGVLALLAVGVAFASASQDIVVDAYKVEVLEKSQFGLGAAIANLGYRGAMLFSGAFALILSDRMEWSSVYLIMAAAMGVGIVTTLGLAAEPPLVAKVPHSMKEAVIEPFLEFFRRKKIVDLIFFIIFYKLDVVFATFLMTPFMMAQGFSRTDIGAVTKGFGLFATIVGTFVGGLWMKRLGMKRSLWVFGVLQGISAICFYFLARLGHHYPMMVTAIAAENFFSGMGTAAYAAFLMSLCHPRFTATQFALLTSLMAVTRNIAGVPTGWLAQNYGWENYFLFSILLMVPGLLLLTRFDAWTRSNMTRA